MEGYVHSIVYRPVGGPVALLIYTLTVGSAHFGYVALPVNISTQTEECVNAPTRPKAV